MIVKVGCCGYPISKSKYYGEFKIVEIQTTFYNIPRERTVEKWRMEAPKDFEFIVKAFQGMTHPHKSPTWRRYRGELLGDPTRYGLLMNTEEVDWSWRMTVKICKLLNSNKVLIQLPPRCVVGEEALSTLERFTKDGLVIILEPRHPSWFNKDIIDFLRMKDIVLCVDPFKNTPIKTFKLHYWRLHGRDGYKYGYKYTDSDLRELVGLIEKTGNIEVIYILFNNRFMYEDAVRFRDIAREGGFETI